MKKSLAAALSGAFALPVLAMFLAGFTFFTPAWNEQELATLAELRLQPQALEAEPGNRFANDPKAAALGKRLFFDARFSSNGEVACASCHLPEKEFQDGKPLATGVGTTSRRTMPIVGLAGSPWFFWDGRKDSLWSQALGPLESPVEHGGNRMQYARLLAANYAEEYQAVFGALPPAREIPDVRGPQSGTAARKAWAGLSEVQRMQVNRVFANMGKAIAAYERGLAYGESRFDRFVDAVLSGEMRKANRILSPDEREGLKLFLGKGECTQCHNGPLFTNGDFANVATPAAPGLPEDRGREAGIRQVLADEFNCLGPYSDAPKDACGELRFLHSHGHDVRKFKVPSLRNVALRPPYMHAGQFQTLEEVVDHYNRAPAAPAGESEIKPLQLSEREAAQLVAFLRTLNGEIREP